MKVNISCLPVLHIIQFKCASVCEDITDNSWMWKNIFYKLLLLWYIPNLLHINEAGRLITHCQPQRLVGHSNQEPCCKDEKCVWLLSTGLVWSVYWQLWIILSFSTSINYSNRSKLKPNIWHAWIPKCLPVCQAMMVLFNV